MNSKQNNLLTQKSISDLIEEQIQREGGLKTKPVKPLGAPVLAQPHTAIYKMHRYWARRPHNVFAHIIQHYTNPGDLVLDPFCGGGVTVVESLRLRRRVVGIDINPLATWITQVEVEPVDLDELEKAFDEWYKWCVEQVSPLFKAECGKCGNKDALAEWYEWSNVVVCPDCGKDVVLAEAVKGKNAVYLCTHKNCFGKLQPSKLKRRSDKMMWVKTRCDKCNETDIRKPQKSDLELVERIVRNEDKTVKREKLFIPDDKFPDMNHVRENDLYEKGYYFFRDWFTSRQRLALARIRKWLESKDYENAILRHLGLLLSNAVRYSNKLIFRVEGWAGGTPEEWRGHMYWPPYIYNENAPIMFMKKKYGSMLRGKNERGEDIGRFLQSSPTGAKYMSDRISSCAVITGSSEKLPLVDAEVDAVITDPPFGGNVQYLELSDLNLVWLRGILPWGGITEKTYEAIQTRHQGFEGAKDLDHYERMLYRIFRECRRVLKPEGCMVMTFHNTDVHVWMALHNAARRAGFRLPTYKESKNRGILYQPAIKNYTQTIHQKRAGSLLGDFILTFLPTDIPVDTEIIRMQLTEDEINSLHKKCEEIIRYHYGLDEPSLWSAILPFLRDSGFLGRILQFDFKLLLQDGPFVCKTENKKKLWYMKDMMENGHLKVIDKIPAEQMTLQIVQDYFKRNLSAEMDDLLKAIYSQLVNSQLPKIETIHKVLTAHCIPRKPKGSKREVYYWKTGKITIIDKARLRAGQNSISFDTHFPFEHNAIIEALAKAAVNGDYDVHIGKTEQRKSAILKSLSMQPTGLDLGFSPKAFNIIKEIDLLIFKDDTILAAIEVVTTLSTLNKAVNDRFRNLLELVPNINVPMFAIVHDDDYNTAMEVLRTPANMAIDLHLKAKLVRLSLIAAGAPLKLFLN